MWSTLIRVYLRGRKRSAPRGRRRPPPGPPWSPTGVRCRRAIRPAPACGSLYSSVSYARRHPGGAARAHDSRAVAWRPARQMVRTRLERDVVAGRRGRRRLRVLEIRGVGGDVGLRRDAVTPTPGAVTAAQELHGVGDDPHGLSL